MTIEIGILIGIITCFLALAGFWSTRQSVTKSSGEHWGAFQAELRADVQNIKDNLSEVKARVEIISDHYSTMRTDVEVVKRDLATAFTKIDANTRKLGG